MSVKKMIAAPFFSWCIRLLRTWSVCGMITLKITTNQIIHTSKPISKSGGLFRTNPELEIAEAISCVTTAK
jgi:hypothetical protein